jgi:hypothetical protein
MDFPVRIAQSRTRREKRESQKGLNRQILSTSSYRDKTIRIVQALFRPARKIPACDFLAHKKRA